MCFWIIEKDRVLNPEIEVVAPGDCGLSATEF